MMWDLIWSLGSAQGISEGRITLEFAWVGTCVVLDLRGREEHKGTFCVRCVMMNLRTFCA